MSGGAGARSPRPRIAVVGAGAAGLSAAFWLHRGGADPVVYDCAGSVGGRAATRWVDGYGFDTGAGAIASTGRHVHRLLTALGVTDEIVPRGVVVGVRTEDGRVHRVDRRRPTTIRRFGALRTGSTVRLGRLALDLARMWRYVNDEDLSTAARHDTRTVQQYLTATFPDDVGDRLLGAFVRGKLLIEPDEASVVDLFAAVKAFLVAGHLWTHPDGIGFFLDRAAARLDVRTATRVVEVRETAAEVAIDLEGADGHRTERFDGCVVAVPAPTMVRLLPGLDALRRDYLTTLRYSRALVVGIGVRDAPDEPASVVMRPVSTRADMPAVGLGHHLAPDRVPPGGGILTGFWMTDWSRRHWEDTDDELVGHTVDQLRALFPSWPVDPAAAAVGRWPHAMVASRVGTFAGLAAVTRQARHDRRVQLAGDFLAQTSINASVAAGETMATRLLSFLRTDRTTARR